MSVTLRRLRRRSAMMSVIVAGATIAMGLTASTGASAGAPMPAAAAAPDTEVQAPIPAIHWRTCRWYDALDCTRVAVPLDYDRPHAATIKLRILKRPAGHPAERIGTLFVNPGGPGGSAADFAPYAAHLLGDEVAKRFDVVGIDPRGVGGSTPVKCKNSQPHPAYPVSAFPYTPKQVDSWLRYDRYVRHLCATAGNPILDHMSTADTARDMDLIRQALGEDKLTYYGISYGTYLGATYAAMFPDHIRAMIVDGVLDPVAWSTGRGDSAKTLPFSTRLRSGVGAWEALTSAFAECDRVGKKRCPLAGNAASKWLRIVHRLRRGPVKVDGGYRLTYANMVGDALGPMYSRPGYRYLMRYIKFTYAEMFGSRSARRTTDSHAALVDLRRAVERFPVPGPYGSPGYGVAYPSFHGVACADSRNPANPRAWVAAGKQADRQGPWFSRLWTWVSSACANWPGSKADAYLGPWSVDTSAPVLVIGNSHDPATPITGARVLNTKLQGSQLLIMDGWGHGALGTSACATSKMERYLVDVRLPPAGTACQPDKQLYPKR
jgi:pimeloyl-ACP methyl ester carboxylesterase